MMMRKNLIDKIAHYASLFVLKIKSHGAMNYTDLNMLAEQMHIPILNTVFDLKLTNANKTKRNHPAVDLVDVNNGVAFQITVSPTQNKVLETLKKFVNYNLHEQYPTLYIYVLSEKKDNYSATKVKEIIQGKFDFDVRKHIIDYRDMLRQINYIESSDKLQEIAGFYEEISVLSIWKSIESHQKSFENKGKKRRSFIDRTREELVDVVGMLNIEKIPDLSELFQLIEITNAELLTKEKELENCKKALDNYPDDETLLEVLTKAYHTTKEEYERLKYYLNQKQTSVNTITQNIRRQKELLDQIDQKRASEREREIKRLFENGDYESINTLINYEGREGYINRKLEEKENQSTELISLANEEVFLALGMLQKQDWTENLDKINTRFEQSIRLGGYGFNTYQYSFFLEQIDESEYAIDVLKKTLINCQDDDLENRALVLNRLGYLLAFSDKEEALNAYLQALVLYESLFERDQGAYEIILANTLYQCGHLSMQTFNENAREYLERGIMVLSTMLNRGNTKSLKITFMTLITLGYLHLKREDINSSTSYHKIALNIGAQLAIEQPDEDLDYLIEAINRFRTLMGEEKNGPRSALLFGRALYYFLKFHHDHSQDENYHRANSLTTLGIRLLVAQEVTGAEICFRNALKIFKILNKSGYSCLPEISQTLSMVAFILMTRNNVKARKKALLEALKIRRHIYETNPVEHLSKAASLLNDLYINSFISTPSSQFYKAEQYFQEALVIYKDLDYQYRQPDIGGWMQLLQHKSTFISKELDQTDAIICYKELIYFKSRISSEKLEFYEENIQISIHQLGEVILKQITVVHIFSREILGHIVAVRQKLYEKDPEKYRLHLAFSLLNAGEKFSEGKYWEEACSYLKPALVLIKELVELQPEIYNKKDIVMPAMQLATGYQMIKEYSSAAHYFIELCEYFESNIQEHSEYIILLVSFLLSAAETLHFDGQKEKAAIYTGKAMIYFSSISNSSERANIASIYKLVIKEYT